MDPSSTPPPKPPSKKRKHCAKKADRMPERAPNSNVLNQYRKDNSGKYWFELIPDEDKAGWHDMISNSIVNYFATMVNSGLISCETNKEYKEYIAAVNKFLVKN